MNILFGIAPGESMNHSSRWFGKFFIGLLLSVGMITEVCLAAGNIPLAPVFGGPPQDPYNIEVTGVEISQGIQNLGNEMPLVAGRSTIVRVYARSTSGQSVPNVRARLFVSGSWDYPTEPLPDGGAQGAGGGFGLILESEPITVLPDGGSRLELGDSFLFEVPLGVPNGILSPAKLTIQAEVNWAFLGGELNSGDNLSPEIVRPLHVADSLKFHFVPVHLHEPAPDADTEVDPDSEVFEHFFLQGAKDLPIALTALRHLPARMENSGLVLSWQGIPVVPLEHDQGTEWNLRRSADRTAVNERIKAVKLMSDDPNRIFYGMIHVDAAAGSFSGWANQGVAWGVMNPQASVTSPWRLTGGMTLAHESGHRKGLAHMLCSGSEASGGGVDPNYPWPVSDTSPCSLADISAEGYYGLDVYHGILGHDEPIVISNDPSEAQPHRGFPLMGYKSPQWVSPYEYCKMMPSFGVPCDLEWSSPGFVSNVGGGGESPPKEDIGLDLLANADEYLIIAGLLDSREGKVHFGPFYRRSSVPKWQIEESLSERRKAEPSENSWLITLENKADEILYTHPIPVRLPVSDSTPNQMDSHHSVGGDPAIVPLNGLLPFPKGTAWIRVRNQGQIIESRQVSASAPQVKLLSPNGREILSPGYFVRWQADDPDRNTLSFTVRFSSDAGKNWQIIELDSSKRELVVTENLLASLGGTDKGLIEVIATDGVNSSSDRSDTVFNVPNARPIAAILLPAEKGSEVNSPVHLRAQALDPEDGLLEGDSLSWSSDRDGVLGTGTKLTTRLSAGRHHLTLTARDSQGAEGKIHRMVEVRGQY